MAERATLTKKSEKKAQVSSSTKPKENFYQSINSPVEEILHLQQTIGNQAVQRLSKSGTIQAKLKIGKPNDKYEQEADRIADKVMCMPEPKGSSANSPSSSVQRESTCPECPEKEGIQTKPLVDQITPLVQQQVDEEEEPVQTKLLQRQPEDEEEEPIQRQPQQEEEEEPIQAKPPSNQTPAGTSNIESSVNTLKGGGQPLSESTRSYFEPRFGADFSHVRVHTDSQAAETAKSINAKAITSGKDVVFGAGQYSPITSSGKRLLAHELTHVVQQKQRPDRNIQRKKDDGHDLTSPLLSRDEVLEACFDGEKILKWGDKGPAVQKLQNALLSLNYILPDYGADGTFKNETKKAVIQFQEDSGLSGRDVDGKVGKRTVGLLDMALRYGKVEKDPHKTAEDLKIKGIYENSKDEPRRIFFEFAQSKIDDNVEREKISKIAKVHKRKVLTLRGYASEEGSAAFNKKLAQARIDEVSTALHKNGHAEFHILAKPKIGTGDINYRYMRATQIDVEEEEPKPETICPMGKETTIPCPDEKLLPEVVDEAIKLINNTQKELPPTSPKNIEDFDKLFRDDAKNNKSRASTANDVNKIFERMKGHIEQMPQPERHRCANICDGGCKTGTSAYNTDKDTLGEKGEKNPPGVITICPPFIKKDLPEQAIIIVHEGHHGTRGIESSDYAYAGQRLILRLDTETALKNAASFQILVECINDINNCKYGPEKPDVYSPNLKVSSDKQKEKGKTKEREDLDLSIRCIEQWIKMAAIDLSIFYANIRRTIYDDKWFNSNTEWLMWFMAPRFGLTRYPTIPEKQDQTAIAAIHDRIKQMNKPFKGPLTFKKVLTGKDSWKDGPGTAVTLTQKFFKLPPSQQAVALVQELVHATENISARLEPEYVALIDYLRKERKLISPTP